jgi:methyl coenzyme M reductase alpha subunit
MNGQMDRQMLVDANSDCEEEQVSEIKEKIGR